LNLPKVIDAILYAGEADILEIRLNELSSVVDHFVIVESAEAHGAARLRKADSFPECVKSFLPKIAYRFLPQLEPPYTDGQSGWARENYHRNALMSPVLSLGAKPEDIILVSDADEIPRASAIKRYLSGPPPGVSLLRLDHYFYNVNCYSGVWMRSSIGTLAAYQDMGGFQAPRGHLGDVIERHVMALGNAGWHFSSFFDISRLREKLETFAHSFEFGGLAALSDEELSSAIRNRRNIFSGAELVKRPTRNPSLPKYFLDNLSRFEHFTMGGLCKTVPSL
jgi:beta-1,4-mannosyl-glycoprotein beta-1,4-N-acetylglucosaminyltransferase